MVSHSGTDVRINIENFSGTTSVISVKDGRKEGFGIGASESPIFPVMVRDNKKVYEIAKELQKRGIFVRGIVYPAVRTKEARLRVSLLASHEKWQLDHLVESLNEINKIIPFKHGRKENETKKS